MMSEQEIEQDYRQWRLSQIKKNWQEEFRQAEAEQKSKASTTIENPSNPYLTRKDYITLQTFKYQLSENYIHKCRFNQFSENKSIIMDLIEPPKPKYPKPEDYCHYCTEGNCDNCKIREQIEEEQGRLAQKD